MPRVARVDVGEELYHVINRANGRLQIFNKDEDYLLFEHLLLETKEEKNGGCPHYLPLLTESFAGGSETSEAPQCQSEYFFINSRVWSSGPYRGEERSIFDKSFRKSGPKDSSNN